MNLEVCCMFKQNYCKPKYQRNHVIVAVNVEAHFNIHFNYSCAFGLIAFFLRP